jgi:hypothetical protein
MGYGMGRKSKMGTAFAADLAVTVLGVAGFLGFFAAGRMDDANASPFDIFAFVWFFTFGGIKLSLPWLLKRARAKRSEPTANLRLSAKRKEFASRERR